mgnify:CR=1 FL=1
MLERIREAAGGASGICGPSVRPASLGGLAYLDTSALDAVPAAGSGSGSTGPGPRHRVVFVLGGPGAGKGTQSDLIVAEYRCVHLSVGELLRAERAREGSPRAALIEECLVQGKIVPVEISLGLVRDAMDGALVDGSGRLRGSSHGCRRSTGFLFRAIFLSFTEIAHQAPEPSSQGVISTTSRTPGLPGDFQATGG